MLAAEEEVTLCASTPATATTDHTVSTQTPLKCGKTQDSTKQYAQDAFL